MNYESLGGLSVVKDQGHCVKTSSDRQIVALFWQIGVAKSNGDVRRLNGSREISVCAHSRYNIGQNNPERLARRRAAFTG